MIILEKAHLRVHEGVMDQVVEDVDWRLLGVPIAFLNTGCVRLNKKKKIAKFNNVEDGDVLQRPSHRSSCNTKTTASENVTVYSTTLSAFYLL